MACGMKHRQPAHSLGKSLFPAPGFRKSGKAMAKAGEDCTAAKANLPMLSWASTSETATERERSKQRWE